MSIRIGVVATSSPMDPEVAPLIESLAADLYPDRTPVIDFAPQCFTRHGHFAGSDAERAEALVRVANDPSYDAVWFGRGGYGAVRLWETALPRLDEAARAKRWLGYSDAGTLLAGLYARGFAHVAHGPMPQEIHSRENGREAAERGLRWLVDGDPTTLESTVLEDDRPTAAFNLMILSSLVGTPLQPDLTNHILMLEEVDEYLYRIDRAFGHVTSNPGIRKVAGVKLGRCAVTENIVDFGMTAHEIAQLWCARANIPYLGLADIGHDVGNKVVPFGRA